MVSRMTKPRVASAHARTINVGIAHNDPYIAAGIAELLGTSTDFGLRTECLDEVDVLITDYSSGMLRAAAPAARRGTGIATSLLVVSEQDRGWQIRRAVDAGVRGYLLQDCSGNELREAVRSLAHGRRYLSRSAADRLLDTLVQAVPTARELEVLQHMACGLGNKNIGRVLGIAEGTVKTHVKMILSKLGEQTRTGAINEAIQRGLLDGRQPFARAPLSARAV